MESSHVPGLRNVSEFWMFFVLSFQLLVGFSVGAPSVEGLEIDIQFINQRNITIYRTANTCSNYVGPGMRPYNAG